MANQLMKTGSYSKKIDLIGSYGSSERSEEPIKEEMCSYPEWHELPRHGGGDIDLADYPLG